MAGGQKDGEVYFTIRLPESLRDKIVALATANERSTSAEVRIAIRKHLEGSTA